jgi:hypothetical protein
VNEVLSKIPSLEDHAAYKTCLDRLTDLEQRLQEARSELTGVGDGPRASVEQDGDLDDAVASHLKATEAHQKLRIRAELKVRVLERALRIENEKVPELRAQAEDMVGHAGAAHHQKSVETLLQLKQQMSDALTLENAIRCKVRNELNKQTAGYTRFQYEERYCWGRPLGSYMPAAAAQHVIAEAVQGGQAQFKAAVHDPAVNEFKALAGRFETVLKRFVG